jgi:hypothetical protein
MRPARLIERFQSGDIIFPTSTKLGFTRRNYGQVETKMCVERYDPFAQP